jgi:hypothetical protein
LGLNKKRRTRDKNLSPFKGPSRISFHQKRSSYFLFFSLLHILIIEERNVAERKIAKEMKRDSCDATFLSGVVSKETEKDIRRGNL